MKIKCLAIDDEPLALKQISAYIEKTPFLENAGLCQSAFEAMEILKNNEIQLMFVDINMPDISGLDFVKSLSVRPQIIFTTAYSEYAYEGFQVDAIDYILKPINYATFLKAVNKAKNWYELMQKNAESKAHKEETLFVKSDYKIVRIHVDDIRYIESANEYIKIFLDDNDVITTLLRLKNILEQLPADRFMRIHRSFIINLTKIKAVDRSRVMMEPKTYIPVGDQYKDDFQAYVDKNFIV
ncbi:MAG: LytTR family DNA-binding domain-containing protein [Paludibacter sp.]|nr:LytTR family DNA-binding domain-containing protein [Paludibacter sp.]